MSNLASREGLTLKLEREGSEPLLRIGRFLPSGCFPICSPMCEIARSCCFIGRYAALAVVLM